MPRPKLLLLVLAFALGPLFALTAAPAQAAPVKDIALTRATSDDPVTGSKVTFNGTAPNSLAGTTVTLLRRVGGKGDWLAVSKVRIGTDGKFTATGTATGVGLNQWRVTAKKNNVVHQSGIVKTTVFSWYYLSTLDEVDEGGYDDTGMGAVAIGGQTYNKSLEHYGYGPGNTSWIEYNLSYRCKTFEAYIGIDDESETGYNASFAAYLDGAENGFGAKGLGPATAATLDTSTRLRIRLETVTNSARGIDGHGAWGNARVLCSGKP